MVAVQLILKFQKEAKMRHLVEFKLASNSKLKKNLENQVEVYKKLTGQSVQ